MPTPSLILVPARFKTGKLYTPLATTSGGVVLSASGDFNVTRATTATRVNASGLIEVVASGIPRLDYPLGGGCPALLVEPSGTNLVVQSENWLASGWRADVSGNVTTVSATTGTLDPYGANTANAISPTSGNTTHLKFGSDGSTSFTSGTIYTSSAFFKQGAGNAGRYVQLTFVNTRFTQLGYANFDLQLGTVAVVSGTSADTNRAASIENYGNGWYRCRFTATCNSAGTTNGISISLIETSGATRLPTFSGTTTDILYGWGAQTETGSIATSYIPTTTASATRNAEVISLSGAVSGCIGQTEGTIYAEVDLRNITGNKVIVNLSNGTADYRLLLQIQTTNTLYFYSNNGGATTAIATGTVTTGTHKIAASYSSGNVQMYLDGSFLASGTMSNYPTVSLTDVAIGTRISSGVYGLFFNDRIRAAALYTTRLTNTELAALTT